MEEALIQLGGAVFTAVLILAPLAWVGLLNLRERRQSAVYAAVIGRFASRDFHGRVAVQVRAPVLLRKGGVQVEVLLGSRDEIWEIIRRLSQIPWLSPQIGLELQGTMDRLCLATFTVETAGRQPLWWVSQASLAAG